MLQRILLITILILTVLSCTKTTRHVDLKSPSIIPAPQSLQVNDGYFTFHENTSFRFDPEFPMAGKFLLDHFDKMGFNELNDYNDKEDNYIYLKFNEEINSSEGYRMKIDPKRILIHASTDAGAFYAVQSLIQLFPILNDKDEIHLPALTIEDEPRFKYRGMHLDVSRHMFPVAFIKKYIDAMAMLKMNNFHWHLTDDQGWRIEIKQYPKLQEVAAYRDSTLLGHYNDTPHKYNTTRYGGYYTQDEVREVIAFAKARHINIIPEIELPGHAQAAIAAYPELGCTNEAVNVATEWGVFDNIYCPNPETFEFLENVLDEVAALFPSPYIHIGGDEAPKTQWKQSVIAQGFIKENGLKDEYELQSYFIKHFEKYLASKGKKIIGWDEILEGGLAKDATVMSWHGMQGAIDAAKKGNDVIMTPTSHCYFDYYQSDNENEPLAIGGFLPLEKVYGFNPIPDELSGEEIKHVLGVQGNVWTEYMPTTDQVEYMAFPRMLALSEVAWSPVEKRDYNLFVNNLEVMLPRLDAMDIKYANHLYEIEGNLNEDQEYELSTKTLGKEIRYTTDGTEPNTNSTIYESPIPFKENMIVKAQVFDNAQPLGRLFSQEFFYHKGVDATITINHPPHKSYSGSGANGLINGIVGSDTRYGDKEWLGFWGDDLEIEIAFDEPTEVNEIQLRFYHTPGQWIYSPKSYDLHLETKMGRISDRVFIPKGNENLITYKYNSERFKGYEDMMFYKLELIIPNYGTIPDGAQGAGNKAWTFIDEIIIK